MHQDAFALIALGILAFGLVSKRLQRSVFTAPMAFTTLGLGLALANIIELDLASIQVATLAELTLVLILFTDATRIDLSLLRHEYGLATRLLGIGLPLTIIVGSLVGALLFENLTLWQAALLAVVLAPTDAALGQAVVSDRQVPVRIRQTLNVESGLNDGLALPALIFLLSLAGTTETNAAAGATGWLRIVGFQLLLAPVVGWLVGYVGGELVDRATRAAWMNAIFTQLSALALALLAFAVAELVGGNGYIAAFVAGLTLGNTKRKSCHQLYEFAEAEGQLLTLFVFLLFGSIMVGPAWSALSWRVLLYVLLSLTLVRMVPVALSLLGTGLQRQTVLFLGWFGPRGIASLIYGLLVLEGQSAQATYIFHVAVIAVLFSTFLHGFSAVPLAKRYGASVTNRQPEAEMAAITTMPLRLSSHESP